MNKKLVVVALSAALLVHGAHSISPEVEQVSASTPIPVSVHKEVELVEEPPVVGAPDVIEADMSIQQPVEVESDKKTISRVIKTADDVAELPNETIFRTMETQSGVTWGLDRVDGSRDGTYNYVGTGSGVRIYIVDTGIDATHKEFGSRVADGFDAFGQNLDQTDCNGHGTHVAGIAAGNYFGVAKYATLVPVRVMDCNGVGNTTTLTDGIEWILASHSGGVGVVNMSIGGNRSEEVNAVTSRLVDAGLVVVVAAGNSGADACNYSPASARGAIAVAAIDMDDNRASFSNYGSCVDISAPGVQINSANALNHFISLKKSGTSQASPFVAGAIATYLSQGQISSPSQAEARMNELSQNGVVTVEVAPEELVEPTPEPIVEPEPVAPEPEPSPSPVVDEPILPDYFVTVNQDAPGSPFGKVAWSPVEGATQYQIYKTGSIRPGWRLFWSSGANATYRNISDKPGAIAIYKVVAIVGSQEIVLGEIEYRPTT